MSQQKTLAELKAENLANEQIEKPEDEETKLDGDDLLDKTDDEDDQDAKGESDDEAKSESGEVEKEAWETQEDEKSSGAKFTDRDMAAQRHALKAKFDRQKEDELQALKAEIEALKSSRQSPPAQSTGTMPKLEDFDYDDGKYQAAFQAWVLQTTQQARKSEDAQRAKEQHEQKLQQQVNAHYERAAKLVQERGIDPDRYQKADLNLRRTMEEAFPGAGELVTDQILSRIGEGSEKLGFYLGNNAAEREKLKEKLLDDPSGLSASIFLGSLLPKLTTPSKRKSSAPDPAARAEGGTSTSNTAASLLKKYNATEDINERIRIKRTAKLAGVKTDEW